MKRYLSFFVIVAVITIFLFLLSGCKDSFQLTFIVDDEVYKTVKTNGKEVITMPDDPVIEGRIFDGWYWDKNTWKNQFTARSLLDAPLSSNMNVYAHFKGENYLEGTDIEITGAQKVNLEGIGDVFLINVSNSQVVFKFNDYVRSNPQTTWILSSDLAGNNIINSKTVELVLGEDVLYYIYVTDKNSNHDTYIVLIHRKYLFTVSFDANGGSYCSPVQVEEGDYLEKIPIPEKKGAEFNGWDYDFETNPITKNVKAKAKWKNIKYEVTLDANGGFVTTNKIEAIYTSTYLLPIPTRRGYDFVGWEDAQGNLVAKIKNVDKNMTLVAQWKNATYSITYELDGGSAQNNPTSYVFGSTTEIFDPVKTGYRFIGWKINNVNKGQNYVIESKIYGDINLVAAYEANKYTVTFDPDGGDCDTQSMEIEYDSIVTLPTPIKNGYFFRGWYDGSTPVEGDKWELPRDVKVKAKWTAINYKITYNMNGGNNATTNPSSFTINSSDISIVNPEKTGYTFTGWTTMNDNVPSKNLIIKSGTYSNQELTANWEANKYVITFDVNSGNALSNNTLDVYYDSNYELPTPTKDGYTFNGWFDNDNKIVNGIWKILDNINVKAKWELSTYSINYVLDGGTNNNSNPSSYTYFDEPITIKDASKVGYTFQGWIIEKTDIPTKSLTIEHNSTGSKTFTAIFEPNKYTITFDVNGGNALNNNTMTVNYDSNYVLPTPTRDGYSFEGWLNNDSIVYNGVWEILSDVNLVAEWKISIYQINYELNGGINDVNNPSTYNYEFETIILKDASKAGHTFLGWIIEKTDTPTKSLTIEHNSTGAKTFTAIFEPNKYTITLDVDGGNILDSNTIDVYYGDNFTLPTPSKENSVFCGWATEKQIVTSGQMKYAEDLYLKAIWVSMSYESQKRYAYFGKYPQTKVTDTNLKSELSQIYVTNASGYIEYEGNEYKEVNNNFYKVEPIKWLIVGGSDGEYILVSDKILDQQSVYTSAGGRLINGEYIEWRNYKYSQLRTWLNDSENGFGSIAFKKYEILALKEEDGDKVSVPTSAIFVDHLLNNSYSTDYAVAKGVLKDSSNKGSDYWCLTPQGNVIPIGPADTGTQSQTFSNQNKIGARPLIVIKTQQ